MGHARAGSIPAFAPYRVKERYFQGDTALPFCLVVYRLRFILASIVTRGM